MRHSLTHAPLFMHGEPESSYELRFLEDGDRTALRETETMERLHKSSALKRQLQQAKEIAQDIRVRRSSMSRESCSGCRSPILEDLPLRRREDPDKLLMGAAKRLNHIVDRKKDSRKVVPTAVNVQYPLYKYQYAEKESGNRRHSTSNQMRTVPMARNTPLSRVNTTVEPSVKEIVTNSSTLIDNYSESEVQRATSSPEARPSFIVVSAEAPELHKLSVELTTHKRPSKLKAGRPSSWVSRAKSSKSNAAWLETLPSAADIKAKVVASQSRRAPRLEEEEKMDYHALSPTASCALILDS